MAELIGTATWPRTSPAASSEPRRDTSGSITACVFVTTDSLETCRLSCWLKPTDCGAGYNAMMSCSDAPTHCHGARCGSAAHTEVSTHRGGGVKNTLHITHYTHVHGFRLQAGHFHSRIKRDRFLKPQSGSARRCRAPQLRSRESVPHDSPAALAEALDCAPACAHSIRWI